MDNGSAELDLSQGKEEEVSVLNEQNKKNFDRWLQTDGSKDLMTIPEDALGYLIPPEAFAVSSDPRKVKIVRVSEAPFMGKNPVTNFLRIAVVEQSSQPVNNIGAFSEYEPYIAPNDRILFSSFLIRNGDQLHVAQYQDNPSLRGRGIPRGYYERLEELGAQIGCRYLTGENDSGNVDYFLNKLGRVRLSTLPEELQDRLGSVSQQGSDKSNFTVKILK